MAVADKKVTKEDIEAMKLTPEQIHKAWLNERVHFRAFYDGEKYKDDLIVSVNGEKYQIQRGQDVYIPRFVHMAISDAERQKSAAATVSLGFENKFRQVEAKLIQ